MAFSAHRQLEREGLGLKDDGRVIENVFYEVFSKDGQNSLVAGG